MASEHTPNSFLDRCAACAPSGQGSRRDRLEEAIRDLLASGRGSKLDPVLRFVEEYHWDLLKACRPGSQDLAEFFDFVALAIKHAPSDYPLGYLAASNAGLQQTSLCSFAALMVSSWLRSDDGGWSERVLLEAVDRLRIPDSRLARVALPNVGSRLAFGWLGEDRPFLTFEGEDIRCFKEVPPADTGRFSELEKRIWSLDDTELGGLLLTEGRVLRNLPYERLGMRHLHGALAALRPQALRNFLDLATDQEMECIDWRNILTASDRFDQDALRAKLTGKPFGRTQMLVFLDSLRGGAYRELTMAAVMDPRAIRCEAAMRYLAELRPELLREHALREVEEGVFSYSYHARLVWKEFFKAMAERWDRSDQEVFFKIADTIFSANTNGFVSSTLSGLLAASPPPPQEACTGWFRRVMASMDKSEMEAKRRTESLSFFCGMIAEGSPARFEPVLWDLLEHKSKPVRDQACLALGKALANQSSPRAAGLLASKKVDTRIVAADLLRQIAHPSALPALQAALGVEASDKVRPLLHEALAACQGAAPAASSAPVPSTAPSVPLPKQASKLRLPALAWLDWDRLPAPVKSDGTPFSSAALALLVTKQAKHKGTGFAVDIQPLLAGMDQVKSAGFGLALVKAFLASGQAVEDRWALMLGARAGDERVLALLQAQVNAWCKARRERLAECAVGAMAYLPGDGPLRALDRFSRQYRVRFKKVGKACAQAFLAAAEIRGITRDELRDLVVPDFGFDEEAVRKFEWEGGEAFAKLGDDLTFTWFDPATDQAMKAAPAGLPEEIRAEVADLAKQIRGTLKEQTLRLEQAMVKQLRWAPDRWRELFGKLPILRLIGSQLVWGIYDASRNLLRTFRRYPNGLFADAGGELEELPEADLRLGIVHPLELDQPALEKWAAHMARFKVAQPFPQLRRAVELPDPLHGNRCELTFVEDKEVPAGTFRSRCDKRGWIGFIDEGGNIPYLIKTFPGAGIISYLPVASYGMGIPWDWEVELHTAFFLKDGNEAEPFRAPDPDHPRVLRFSQIPPIVWSETLTDLKAIIGEP